MENQEFVRARTFLRKLEVSPVFCYILFFVFFWKILNKSNEQNATCKYLPFIKALAPHTSLFVQLLNTFYVSVACYVLFADLPIVTPYTLNPKSLNRFHPQRRLFWCEAGIEKTVSVHLIMLLSFFVCKGSLPTESIAIQKDHQCIPLLE